MVANRARLRPSSKGAVLAKGTFAAARRAGDADAATVEDQCVRRVGPLALRKDLLQGELDLDRVGFVREPESSRKTGDVRIDGDRRDAEPSPEHDVCGLAADPRERRQLVHGARALAPVPIEEGPTEAAKRLRLVAEEAGRVD